MRSLHVACERCGLEAEVETSGQTNFVVIRNDEIYSKCPIVQKELENKRIPDRNLLLACPPFRGSVLREHKRHP
jgi:hypothetical protein